MRIPFGTATALAVAAMLLFVAIGAGAAVGALVRRTPVPVPTPSPTPLPSPTPVDTGPLVFEQPLSSGCASRDAVWVVSDGGGVGRFDGQRWELVDSTLRSLVDAVCAADAVYAVGPSGRLLTLDDRTKTIRADDIGYFDAYGISLLPDGALVVGSGGTVRLQNATGWQQWAGGIEEDLFGIAALSVESAWTVGSRGASYRLEAAGWRAFPTGTSVTLRTVTAISPIDAVAAGDGGALLRFDGRWRSLDSGVKSTLRASARAGALTVVVGDAGVALAVEGERVRRIDLGTTCPLRGVFTRASEIWFVGSDATRAGVWRQSGDKLDRWGTC